MLQVENQNIELIDRKYCNVQDPEEGLEEGLVHVPVVAVIGKAPVSVLDHHEPGQDQKKTDTSQDLPEYDRDGRHVVPAGYPGALEVLHGGTELGDQPLVVREVVGECSNKES